MKNKEVIDKLQEFYLKQDPKLVARALASCMIDYNRLVNYDKLGKNEKFNFDLRVRSNADTLRKFVEYGAGEFKLLAVNSD